MEFYERVSGARMHAAFYRPNEVNIRSISYFLLEDMVDFTRNCLITLNEMHNVLTYSKIWKQRLVNIGAYSYKNCIEFGLTGVMARCTGIKRDVRLDRLETYANYYHLNFRSYVGHHGDCYDRFLIRMNEMTESLNIMNQVINKMIMHNKPNEDIQENSNINPHFILKYLNPAEYNSYN